MLDWWFRNRETGGITIAQFPNVALGVFLGAAVVRWFVPHGWFHSTLDLVALVALAWWAVDEVVRGVNPWRRLLGGFGCLFVASGLAAFVH
jgi:hypothetical protein